LAIANDHTEFHLIDDVLDVLAGGDDVAVVSDAGTPGISDPGERLVVAAIAAGHSVAAVPGPVAAITALTISGLPADRFVFEGFLPRSGRDRKARIDEIAGHRSTTVIYEAPHRIARTIADLAATCGESRPVVVCRELTKLYETVVRGELGTIELGEPKGEYVIVLAGAPDDATPITDEAIVAALRVQFDAGATTKDAVAVVSGRFGVPKKAVYALAIANR
jgi:16S rRNA (cytidine1402-2'-O)-methyltransferase